MRAIAIVAIVMATSACQAETSAENDTSGDRARYISSEAEAAYFEIQDELFGLSTCDEARHREAADQVFVATNDFVISNFGHETAMRLEEEAADRYRTAMVVQCTGDAGVSDLKSAYERMSQTATG